jgi:hypothetical protein
MNEEESFHANMDEYHQRAVAAQLKAAQAFGRLLNLAESRDSGQTRHIAQFLAATYNGSAFTFDLFDLRVLDVSISDDMLCCLDALRWGRADLYQLVPDGDKRMQAVIAHWGLQPVHI